jgi:hypothetical protein
VRFERVVVVNPSSPPGLAANCDCMGGFSRLFPGKATTISPLKVPYLAGYLVDTQFTLELLGAEGLAITKEYLAEAIEYVLDRRSKNDPTPLRAHAIEGSGRDSAGRHFTELRGAALDFRRITHGQL